MNEVESHREVQENYFAVGSVQYKSPQLLVAELLDSYGCLHEMKISIVQPIYSILHVLHRLIIQRPNSHEANSAVARPSLASVLTILLRPVLFVSNSPEANIDGTYNTTTEV